MLDIIIFNIELGQCIFFYPRSQPKFGLMVDCGNTENFEPINQIIKWNLLPEKTNDNPPKPILKNLTITNYDQDHFSGLPYLKSKVKIETTRLPKNISSQELRNIKEKITKPIEEMIKLKDDYTNSITLDTPYKKDTYHLEKSDFPDIKIDTNKLSQIVFVSYKGVSICIPGDLDSSAWEKLLLKDGVQSKLRETLIFVASHHGREDGYNEKVFNYCLPEVIILSDKDIVHKTQEGQTQLYSSKVKSKGIVFNGNKTNLRKTLTTRSDGNLWIRIEENGTRTYKSVEV